jgi:hypothetical protein
MDNTAKSVLIFLAGIFIGILIMSVLSYRASRIYLDGIEAYYKYGQRISAKQAIKEHNYFVAVFHCKNLVAASRNNQQNSFQKAKNIWTLSFPFSAEILKRIKAHSDPNGLAEKRDNGMNHGLLAYSLEKYGMQDEANIEWEKSSELLDQKDLGKLKQLIENIVKN